MLGFPRAGTSHQYVLVELLCAGYFNDRQTGEAILVTRSARLGTRTYICWVSDLLSFGVCRGNADHRSSEFKAMFVPEVKVPGGEKF